MTELSRRMVFAGGALAAALAVSPRLAIAQAAGEDLGLGLVDPDLRAAAARAATMQKLEPPMTRARLVSDRTAIMRYLTPALPEIPYSERRISGRRGNPDVTVFVINVDSAKRRPVIVHMHGGGFVNGKAILSVRSLQELCRKLDCVAVSVDYRLAPETTYAGSLEDNYAALNWVYTNADALGADRSRIALLGESAGGGHAALLAQVAHARGEVPVAFQCLIYPMLDDRTGSSRPVPPQIGNLGWTRASNRFGWEAFLGQRPGGSGVPSNAVPARAANLSGLPPTFIGVGALDLFVEEDVTYAQRLISAAVPTELLVVPGAFHGFDLMAPEAAVTKRFAAAQVNALRRAFAKDRS